MDYSAIGLTQGHIHSISDILTDFLEPVLTFLPPTALVNKPQETEFPREKNPVFMLFARNLDHPIALVTLYTPSLKRTSRMTSE